MIASVAMLVKASQTPPGAFVEVGVYQGRTAVALTWLAREQGRSTYLYDTFCGIPWKCDLDSHVIGDFKDCDAKSVQALCPSGHVVPGIFPDSAVSMGPIAFVHLDCDQYRSYRESIAFLLPKMVPGGVMWFDDAPSLAGAEQAVREMFENPPQRYRDKSYVEL